MRSYSEFVKNIRLSLRLWTREREGIGQPLKLQQSVGEASAAVAQATGLSRNTIMAGIKDVQQPARSFESLGEQSRVRQAGGGRKPLSETDRRLERDLKKLLDSSTRGHPQSPLKWTSKSTRHLATELEEQGHQVGHNTVARLLHQMGYSLQANRKTKEGADHPDRDAQFEHINRKVIAFQKRR